MLGKIKELDRTEAADLIIVDAPPAGHAASFLASAAALQKVVASGPVRAQADEVAAMLSDPSRCQCVLVTLPEETPVNEVVETAFKLEDRVGIALGPIVVNGVYPQLDGLDADPGEVDDAQALRDAARFRLDRMALQAEQVARLAAALPLPQLRLPYLFTTEVGPAEVDVLADSLAREVSVL